MIKNYLTKCPESLDHYNLMYKDLKLLELQPMSEWLYNPIFWKISIELVIIVAVAAMFLTNPFGLSIIGLGLIACFVFSAVAFCSHFSSDSTSNESKQIKPSPPDEFKLIP